MPGQKEKLSQLADTGGQLIMDDLNSRYMDDMDLLGNQEMIQRMNQNVGGAAGDMPQTPPSPNDAPTGDGKMHQPVDPNSGMKGLKDHAGKARPGFEQSVNKMIGDTKANDKTRSVRTRHKHDDALSAKQNSLMEDEVYRMGTLEEDGQRHKYKDVKNSGAAKGLKKDERIQQKADEKYGVDITRVLDVVRGTMSYNSMGEMHKALVKVWNDQKKYGFEIVRCKQTYRTKVGMDPTFYGDVKFSIKMDGNEHVCELQFQHIDMVTAKDKGHKGYEHKRDVDSRKKAHLEAPDDNRVLKQAMHDNHRTYEFVHGQISKEKEYGQVVKDMNALQAYLEGDRKGKPPAGFGDVLAIPEE